MYINKEARKVVTSCVSLICGFITPTVFWLNIRECFR